MSEQDRRQLPYFNLPTFSDLRKYGQLGITANNSLYHAIENLGEFYKTFGYDKKAAEAGYAPDEFIWERYIKPGAPKCRSCIQHLIITYLAKHSTRFMNEYSEEYSHLRGLCVLDKIDASESCIDCIHHPVHLYESIF